MSAFLVAALLISQVARGQTPKAFKITVGRETTYITEPLNPDGTPNYVAATNAICGRGVTPDNNAAVLLLKALGPEMLENKGTRGEVYRLLRIPPLRPDGAYFVPFPEYARGHLPEDTQLGRWQALVERLGKLGRAPWGAKDDPLVAGWIQANARALDLAVSASRRERMFIPLVSPSNPPTLYDCFNNCSTSVVFNLSRALAARAMLRLGRGEVHLASADILAVHRLAALMTQGPMILDILIAMGFDGSASQADNALARSGRLTASQLRRHLAAVVAVPEVRGINESQQGPERFFQLDVWLLCARRSVREVHGPSVKLFKYPLESLPDYPLDWDEVLRMQNAHLDRLVAAGRLPTFRQRAKALKALKEEIDKVVGADKKAYALKMVERVNAKPRPDLTEITRATFYYLEGCPGPVMAFEDRSRAFRRTATVSMALAAWRAEKGSYPDKLDALSPTCLKAIPPDPFTDKPLTYRRVGEGYVLYSLGENMTDDGGIRDLDKGADDINLDFRPK